MAGNTLTRAGLGDAVYQKVGLSRAECAALVELVLDEMTSAILRGENVKLSSFGSFIVRSRRVLVFKPSNVMKARVNGQVVEDEAE
jgi:integration host factor subunit alpha